MLWLVEKNNQSYTIALPLMVSGIDGYATLVKAYTKYKYKG